MAASDVTCTGEMSDVVLSVELEVLESIYIDELTVEKDENDWPHTISIVLHPATAMDTSKMFVCMTLCFYIPHDYPESVPNIAVKNPRGLGEEELQRVIEELNELAQMKKGEHMLFDMIEKAKEHLTEGNIPSCECSICLEQFVSGDQFMKTNCYHYFHSVCLGRYAISFFSKEEEEDEEEQGAALLHSVAQDNRSQKRFLCPMCREPLVCDIVSLLAQPIPKEAEEAFVLSPSMVAQQQEMQALYNRQKERGGIIDLQKEKNKFLVDLTTVVTLRKPTTAAVDSSEASSAPPPSGKDSKSGKNYSNSRQRDDRPESRRGNRTFDKEHDRKGGEYRGANDNTDRRHGNNRCRGRGAKKDYHREDRNTPRNMVDDTGNKKRTTEFNGTDRSSEDSAANTFGGRQKSGHGLSEDRRPAEDATQRAGDGRGDKENRLGGKDDRALGEERGGYRDGDRGYKGGGGRGNRGGGRGNRGGGRGNRGGGRGYRDGDRGYRDGDRGYRDGGRGNRDGDNGYRDGDHGNRDGDSGYRDGEHVYRDGDHGNRDGNHGNRGGNGGNRGGNQGKRQSGRPSSAVSEQGQNGDLNPCGESFVGEGTADQSKDSRKGGRNEGFQTGLGRGSHSDRRPDQIHRFESEARDRDAKNCSKQSEGVPECSDTGRQSNETSKHPERGNNGRGTSGGDDHAEDAGGMMGHSRPPRSDSDKADWGPHWGREGFSDKRKGGRGGYREGGSRQGHAVASRSWQSEGEERHRDGQGSVRQAGRWREDGEDGDSDLDRSGTYRGKGDRPNWEDRRRNPDKLSPRDEARSDKGSDHHRGGSRTFFRGQGKRGGGGRGRGRAGVPQSESHKTTGESTESAVDGRGNEHIKDDRSKNFHGRRPRGAAQSGSRDALPGGATEDRKAEVSERPSSGHHRGKR